MTKTPKRDAWVDARDAFDELDCDAYAYPSDEEYDALESAAEAAKAEFLASGEPHLYEIQDDTASEQVEAADMAAALEEAKAWAREGDWGDDGTAWIRVRVRDIATDEGPAAALSTWSAAERGEG